jgi:hypothetical protein
MMADVLRRWLSRLLPLAVMGSFAGLVSNSVGAVLPFYSDHLLSGFQDWSWGARSFTNSTPVHSGTNSIAFTGAAWDAISFEHGDFDVSLYTNLSFWIHGGASGGQLVRVYCSYGANDGTSVSLKALPTNAWTNCVISLASLGVAAASNLNRINLQLTSSGNVGAFYVDDVQLLATPPPAQVNVGLDVGQVVRGVDGRWFGVNTAIYDGNLDNSQSVSLFKEMGARLLRFPGGSMSDAFHWRSNYVVGASWQGWPTRFTNFARVATNVGAEAMITVNYGTGTPAEAVDWVRYSNITNRYGFKYWEIGNEVYGSWETDSNVNPHDPYTYAVRCKDFIQQMKAADSTVKIGLVVCPGESSYSNAYTVAHPATNSRTGAVSYGWTPILLATLKQLGVTPDFVSHHVYAEFTDSSTLPNCPLSDALLLQSTRGWASDAADLRQQISDYFGASGANIELLCTENNADSGAQGKQSVSLVNGIYLADSLGQLMQTEFDGFVWWDFRNGTETNGSLDASLYGWRMFGDIGMVGSVTNRYPPFYGAKMISFFAPAGGSILRASSSYAWLSAYGSQASNGAVSLLLINKDSSSNLTARVVLTNFMPGATATVRTYGIPQDEAARTNGVYSCQDIASGSVSITGTNFTYACAPLSLNLLTFTPAAPRLAVSVRPAAASPFVLQLQGQMGARYVLQYSTNLSAWTNLLTNTLSGPVWNLTNPPVDAARPNFWRAAWF